MTAECKWMKIKSNNRACRRKLSNFGLMRVVPPFQESWINVFYEPNSLKKNFRIHRKKTGAPYFLNMVVIFFVYNIS